MIGWDSSNPISRDGKILVGGSARRQKRVATNRFVKMNGDRTYVTRRDRSAPIVPIQCDYHGVMKIRTNINCPNIKTRVANPIHINAVCHLLMTLTSFSMTVSMVHLLFFNCIKSLFCDKYGNIVSSINQIDTEYNLDIFLIWNSKLESWKRLHEDYFVRDTKKTGQNINSNPVILSARILPLLAMKIQSQW